MELPFRCNGVERLCAVWSDPHEGGCIMRTTFPGVAGDENDSPMPHGGGIALATAIMFVGWLGMYLLI
jgi:hypothetical protein